MHIYYHLSRYISHRLTGEEYIACLRSMGHTVYTRHEELPLAGIAVIHDDPLNYASIFSLLPRLNTMRTIAYCVWESSVLCQPYREALRLVQEIWTPSHFSQQSMLPHFPRVAVVPHIVRRQVITPENLAFAKAAVHADEEAFRFFAIVDAINPRKNIQGLLAAFTRLRAQADRKIVLVLKQYRANLDYSGIPGVINVEGGSELGADKIAALHVVCDAYVSAHHAEGWGLGISEAMAYGKPAIATGYSGNMEFMTAENSLPVPYILGPVSDDMCARIPLFTKGMQWANIDMDALVHTMKHVAAGRIPQDLPHRAAAITQQFSPKEVGRIMQALLEEK